MILDVRYAKAADGTHVAWAELGDGPIDIVYSFGYLSNIDDFAEWDIQTALWDGLSSFSRLILFDRRGSGLSIDVDPGGEHARGRHGRHPSGHGCRRQRTSARRRIAGRRHALHAVRRVASRSNLGVGPLRKLASWAAGLDFPWAWTAEEWDDYLSSTEQTWGTPKQAEDQLKFVLPSITFSPDDLKTIARSFRSMASPGAASAVERMLRDLDVRPVLPAIRVPTLVLHATGDMVEPVGAGRYIAESIPGARFIELPGGDHVPHGEMRERFVEEVRRFAMSITDEEAELGRVLGTVLFTDIVGSTERAADMGDRAWGDLLERHHSAVRAMLARYRGQEVDTAGDGFFATFDGPARAVRCAQHIRDAVEQLGLRIRAGVHTGELHTIGQKVGGLGVVIGARVGALAGPSEVLVSQTVKDLVAGSGLSFEDAGEHELKGVPDRWRVYRVVG